MSTMKLYKLITHQKNFSVEDLILNSKELPDAKIGDVVEIFLPEDDGVRLLLQITNLNEDKSKGNKDVISIESSIASAFNLPTYSEVVMRIIDPANVALDSVEITFKDQYMGRSEMWRLKTYLTNTCVYTNKKIEYCTSSIRCQIYELWSQGDRVACGVITEDTKVVFRSSTSMVYLFIQMSSEMWDFDIHGDLYFEKAVNGFLTDLFMKWKKMGCNHEVTIVLFSRTFYAAKSLEEFPPTMRECLQMDYKGRYYEDFYRVAIQNERNDDWSSILVQLRKLFTAYQSIVLHYHERTGVTIPPATNSTAAQGNFLEVLNISLNVFEKHYLDRSFDRTGQLSVVITPGVGVFEVDRELTNITKQRIIDNGVGSDLVCVGEQPLHAVPLLKFHNKDSSIDAIDDYSMPHWINLSFYSTNKKVAYSSFIPRIKLPPLRSPSDKEDENKENQRQKFSVDSHQSEYIHNSLFDYDAYDAQIFTLPSIHGTCSLQRNPRAKKSSVPNIDIYGTTISPSELKSITAPKQILSRKRSEPDIHYGTNNLDELVRCDNLNISESMTTIDKQTRNHVPINESKVLTRPGRALINPFAPSHVTIKLTSNRRRWTHIFPKGPTGVLIQQHHYQAVPTNSFNFVTDDNNQMNSPRPIPTNRSLTQSFTGSICSLSSISEYKRKSSALHSPAGPMVTVEPSRTLTLLWGATGEQEWTPALTTGVDWKSLTIPACLPITTDYFPDQRSLHNDYVVSDYTLLPDSVNAEYAANRAIYRKPLTTEEVFRELISQRLAQGFQLIVMPDKNEVNLNISHYMHSSRPSSGSGNVSINHLKCGTNMISKTSTPVRSSIVQPTNGTERTKEFLLSIGRIFHKIGLVDSEITVTRYRPRHPYPPINVDYRYRFQAPQHSTYEISGVNFTTEKLEHFNWNYMDQYICTRGDTDYLLQENLKYWRYRMYLLPKEHPATKKILESPTAIPCDIYIDNHVDSVKQQIDDFIRFVEQHLNKLRKSHIQRSTTRLLLQGSPTVQQSHLTRRRHSTSILPRPPPQVLANSPFRERLGSNRLPATRPRSGSKVFDRSNSTKVMQASDASMSLNPEPSLVITTEDNEETFLTETKLNVADATITEIFEAFRHPATGVSFLAKVQSLPSHTFVSYDAINWLNNRIDGQFNAIEILERMRREGMICHASGEISKPIVAGYFLYYIVLQDTKSKDYVKPLNDLEAFENEWMEIELKYDNTPNAKELNVPRYLHDSVEMHFLDGPVYKQLHLEIDPTQKSDRVEWGHVRYHTTVTPGYAFELVVQWLTASGPIVYELIYGWIRKAQLCGFNLVPIPADLLAEPFTEKSDPLRGPIFIPLNTTCLEKDGNLLFKEFRKETLNDRLILFQEAIVARFGFMPSYVETKMGSNESSFDRQYVHCTGNMFVLVPSPHQGLKIRRRLASGSKLKKPTFIKRYPLNNVYTESQSTTHDTYVTRHVNLLKTNEFDVPRKIGFLWSWNHMVPNKKWKSFVLNSSPEGELFQLRMLADFKDFCSNQNDRLVRFYEECWEKKEAAIQSSEE